MKKILAILIALVAVVSCSKDNTSTEDTTPKLDDRLVGCSFYTEGYSAVLSLFGRYGHVFEFYDESTGIAYYTDRNGRQNGSDGEFTYVLNYPDLTIKMNNLTSEGEVNIDAFRFKDARSFALVQDDGELSSLIVYYKL